VLHVFFGILYPFVPARSVKDLFEEKYLKVKNLRRRSWIGCAGNFLPLTRQTTASTTINIKNSVQLLLRTDTEVEKETLHGDVDGSLLSRPISQPIQQQPASAHSVSYHLSLPFFVCVFAHQPLWTDVYNFDTLYKLQYTVYNIPTISNIQGVSMATTRWVGMEDLRSLVDREKGGGEMMMKRENRLEN
jgi:hypothetical protein